MYLHLGQNEIVPDHRIIGIFDLDNTSWSFRTRKFLDRAEAEGLVTEVGEDLPRAFVLCQEVGQPPMVYLTQLNAAALRRRAESGTVFENV